MFLRSILFPFFLCLILVGGCSDASDSHPDSAAVLTTPSSDCFWQITRSPRLNEEDNLTWTDLSGDYGNAIFRLSEEGAYITLESQFPHSRYMSYTSYGLLGGIVDILLDKDILPDTGSTNPYVAGSPRNDPSRIYSVTVKADEQAGDGQFLQQNILMASQSTFLAYRVYLSDTGADAFGDAALPRVTLHRADGSILQGEEACSELNIPIGDTNVENIWYTESEYAEYRESADPSRNPPAFKATYNFSYHKQCDFGGDCSTVPEAGLRYPFPDPRYLYGFINRQHGKVLVLRGKLPETPKTFSGDNDVAVEGQLRFWSICEYEYYSTRAEACLFDEQVEVNEDGFYTIVVSREEDLPTNATSDCGVSHLGWSDNGDGFGIEEGRENYPDDGFLLVRNIVPSPGFTQAIPNSDSLNEEEIMGEYLTKGRYFSKAEFEGFGCNPWLVLPYNEM